MPTDNTESHGYLMTAIGGLVAAVGLLWRRSANREDAMSAALEKERTAALAAVRENAEAHETLLRATLTTVQGFSAALERTNQEVEELAARQDRTERTVEKLVDSSAQLVRAVTDNTAAVRELVVKLGK